MSKVIYKLYIITCKSTNKQYIGVTRLSLKKRWKDHIDSAREGRKYAISGAIRKYGVDDFSIKELLRVFDKDEVSNLEKEYIVKFNTLIPNGYNMIEGGLDEIVWTDDIRKRQSKMATENNLKRYEDPKQRLKNKRIADKQWQDPDFRKKVSDGHNLRFLKSLLVDHTPIEKYEVNGFEILVKREDLCAKPPLPPFSKVRGVYKYLLKLKDQGIEVVGYTETSVSMAGVGVAAISKYLGLKCVIFNPIYSENTNVNLELLERHRELWKQNNAEIIPMPAGRAKVNFYNSRNQLYNKYTNKKAYMLPLGLPFEETIEATSEEFKHAVSQHFFASVVVNIGSGTICAGVLRGATPAHHVYGIMGRTGSVYTKYKTIYSKAGLQYPEENSLGFYEGPKFTVADPGWQYTQKVNETVHCPFPCHPYYDLKAWHWLTLLADMNKMKGPILFWNIGREA